MRGFPRVFFFFFMVENVERLDEVRRIWQAAARN